MYNRYTTYKQNAAKCQSYLQEFFGKKIGEGVMGSAKPTIQEFTMSNCTVNEIDLSNPKLKIVTPVKFKSAFYCIWKCLLSSPCRSSSPDQIMILKGGSLVYSVH